MTQSWNTIDTQKPLMTKSYKMMWRDPFIIDGLSAAFNITDFKEYTPGRQFVAKFKDTYERFGVLASVPVFHFCDNALDILMWYWEVMDFFEDTEKTIHFFEIKPHGKVYKNRVPDETRLWQCGCNKIEIVKETTLAQVAQDACKEIAQNPTEIIARYPHYDMIAYCAKIKNQATK